MNVPTYGTKGAIKMAVANGRIAQTASTGNSHTCSHLFSPQLLAMVSPTVVGTALSVHTLDALSDNYMYLIVCETTKQAAVVDPVEPAKCAEAAMALGAQITFALTTHHHCMHRL